MAQDEFVDLYALLGVETDADDASIRKRASALYLEAQNNLDHRNPAKRLQWQQLYEVYLPQARHLLLDATRRAEYNRYLAAYRSGKPLAEVAPAPVPVIESGGIEVMDDGALEMVEPDVDPEVVAAQREEVWGKWKSSLNFGDAEDAPASTPTGAPIAPIAVAPDAASLQTASSQAASSPAASSQTVAPKIGAPKIGTPQAGGAAPRHASAEGAASRRPAIQTVALGEPKAAAVAAPQRMTPEDLKKQSQAEWERKRATERENLMSEAAAGAGLTGSFIGGSAAFVTALILLYVTDSFLSGTHYPLGMSRLVFTLLGFVFSVIVAAIAAAVAANKLRAKKLADLGSLSLEELQRRR